MNSLYKILTVSCAIVFGYYNTAAYGDAVEQSNNQENNISRRAYSSKCGIICKLTYYPSVSHIVKLLKKLSDKQRQRKQQELLYN